MIFFSNLSLLRFAIPLVIKKTAGFARGGQPMDLQERINSCKCFAEGRCPNQLSMERAYLIPQLMDPRELQACERVLEACEERCPHARNSASEVQK